MCATIIVGKKEIETYKEFKEYFKIKGVLERYIQHDETIDNQCLCVIDIPKTFKKHKIKYRWDGCYYLCRRYI